eukprot:scaffold150142_cov42-Attheya_sp.AAC.1
MCRFLTPTSSTFQPSVLILHAENGRYKISDRGRYTDSSEDSNNDKNADDVDNSSSLKVNRFSKFAPDANLPTEEFRAQLRENMKADLERRRKEDPNRGNQPAKNYLDN